MPHRVRPLIVRGLLACAATGLLILAALAWSVSDIGEDVRGCLVECAPAARISPSRFKIITLNLFHGYPRFENVRGRLDLVARQLREEQPDFVLLQEVPWRSDVGWAAEYLSGRTALNYVYLRGNGNRRSIWFEEGLAILSRYPLSNERFTELAPRDWLLEHRIALAITAQTPAGLVQLVTAHLTTRETDGNNDKQTASLEAFISGLRPYPTILAGDFNAHEDSPQIRRLKVTWIDAFRHVHTRTRNATCCLLPTELDKRDAGPFSARIDYIFLKNQASKRWEVLAARPIFDRPFKTRNGYQWASNHIGVLVEASLKDEPSVLSRK